MRRIRYAVVGLNHGKSHVTQILKEARAELAAVCDQKDEAVNEALKLAPNARGFGRYDELLKWGGFDAVVIATPPFLHREMAAAAFKDGKHVLLEKPLAATLEDARAIVAAHRGCQTVCQVGYEVRSSQLVQRLLRLIRDGRLGDVVFVWWHMFLLTETHGWRAERNLGCGKLFDCCCHYWDILQLLAGARLHRVSAFGQEKGKIGPNANAIPTVATVNFEYENGVRGNLSLSEISPTPEWSLFGVVGTNGIVYGNPWRPEGAGSLDCYVDGGVYREQIVVNGDLASRGHLGFAEQHTAFLDAILDGKAVPCTLEDACEVAVVGAAIDRSLSTGNTVLRSEVADCGAESIEH